ncbi:PREDICTED: slowpoke-binding protein isoform X1 [Polistes dominula]|uniref:Slowpoke-binding protein isoform X1 n=1 Tax=Polistes dominula TaxID=743375 RepID=A0ABM1IBT3_POLDO|nr:PREDICTED: slowpoke-binding protein isoform X1 [Polistes dominula]XP_015177664.1 PREDICTED: slowpoke-binding protein isoform X1 [Polistes dominula]XP_015177665.1 PREDICTED: slowpoke-binding protein isoform X1 [Polistes dominula]XP_015177667.1 PREDICTED: slowpoke-binding protein isoform X1 [Polistes dominula]XP_015177670.1 PREDICTED: slowpoke-binding protein isoform X1 [Polistes dominula]
MFNLYQSLNKKDEGESHRESDVTGHDRFWQERPRTRRKRRAVNRRTQSAIELDSEAMVSARGVLRRGRSASIEDDESEEEKGYQLTNKIDNLAKILFNRVSAARGCRDQNEIRNGRHHYTALGHGPSACEDVGEYVEMEKRSRDRALSICQTYIQRTSRYTLIKQLNNIGSRVDKHWFAVRDTSLKTDRLITLMPLNRNCPLSICPSTKDILNNLFLALQHPYICPIFGLEFLEYEELNYVVLIQPINHGSLKDLIYGIERNCWNDDWSQKYASRGKGLPLSQIQQMGRQILEALVFLKERGFPVVSHLHSGNVVVQNGVARLAGLENTLLGFKSRIHPIVTTRLTKTSTVDVICFGHMLFEMCAGYELCSFKPTAAHLSDIEIYPQVIELLEIIFDETRNRYPSIEELLIHDLFRNIDLREMRCAPVTIFRPALTPSIINFLDGIKQQNLGKRFPNLDSKDMISLKSPEAEYQDSLLVQIYNELSNTTI